MNKINNFLIGSDPEWFIYSNTENKFITSCGKIGGTKHSPIPFSTIKGFTIQEDNVAVEGTIPPVNNLEEWLHNLNFLKNYVRETILTPKGYVPKYISSARFEEKDLDNKQAQVMGCDTSYSAYTFLPHKVDRSDYTLRTTGMHVHIGYDKPDADLSLELIKAMDLYLGIGSVLIDKDDERRKMYGKAGDWRLKEYGCEYRSLGGYFMDNDELLAWVYNNTLEAIRFINEGNLVTSEMAVDIVKCIDTCDRELAVKLIDKYKINVLNHNLITI